MAKNNLKNKLYINLLLIVISGSIFYFVIYPKYTGSGVIFSPTNNISSLLKEKGGYENALTTAENYLQKINQTNNKYNEILTSSQTDPVLSKLDKILPTKTDPILIIYDLSKIAARPECSMILSSPSYTTTEVNKGDNNKKYETMTITTSLKGTYDNMKAFLKDLETSEKIYNVKSLSFTTSEDTVPTTLLDFNITIETYYLK